ncbi:hypothetical protein O181_106450 [Austropuccinia psidii MF-1]|uniref:Uncharacterized protein n=1 Tax=Austropuccinia psidii MF-1 TaxID=1389203 RepID=A0A9Q3PMQ6_9BASI|nr:hypothetical protein [Austropuccinia psidii MF-1]
MKKLFISIRQIWKRKRQDQGQNRQAFLRKEYLEYHRIAPHSPMLVTASFDTNSEPEIIQGNALRVEPLTSKGHKNLSVPVNKLVQKSKGRGMENISCALAGGHELILTNPELSVSGEEHGALKRMESSFFQRKGKEYK